MCQNQMYRAAGPSDSQRPSILVNMKKPIRVEITGRNSFWQNAVQVEWEHQYPDRHWIEQGDRFYLIEAEWLLEVQRIALQCFATAVVAPEDVGKRKLFRQLLGREDDAG